MDSTHPTHAAGQVVQRLYAAVAAGDADAMADCLHPQVRFHVPGRSVNTGDYHGIPAVLAFLGGAAHRSGGTLQLELRDVAVGLDHVVAVARYTAQRDGKTLDNRLCHALRLEDGRVRESVFYTGDQYAVDAFWND